jgi:hypothetical protein
MRLVPCLCNHLGGCQYAFALASHLPPSAPRRGEGGGEGRQACAAAQALKPSQPFSIASRRRMALPTNVSLTIVDVIGRDSSTAQVFDRPLSGFLAKFSDYLGQR